MALYRKKPVVIEAVQWTGENAVALLEFSNFNVAVGLHDGRRVFIVSTLEGTMIGELKDWLIKGIKGEFYPCKPDVFEMTYDPIVRLTP